MQKHIPSSIVFSSRLTSLLWSNRVYFFFFHSFIWYYQQKQCMVYSIFSPQDGNGYCYWNSSVQSSRNWTVFINLVSLVLLTYLVEQSPSCESNQFSTTQEITGILWNPKVRYRIHKCLNEAFCVNFRNLLCFHGEELLAPHPTPILEDYPLLAADSLYLQLPSVLVRSSTVVKALCYKSEGHWFDSIWCHWNFSLT